MTESSEHDAHLVPAAHMPLSPLPYRPTSESIQHALDIITSLNQQVIGRLRVAATDLAPRRDRNRRECDQ